MVVKAPPRKNILIGGCGISGLSLAYSILCNTQFNVIVAEKKDYVGGWMHTKKYGNSFVDVGPRSIRVRGGEKTLSLLNEIKLNPIPASGTSKDRFIYYSRTNNETAKIHSLPSSIYTIPSKLPMWKEIIKTQIQQSFQNKKLKKNETIHNFFIRQFGNSFSDKLVSAMMLGIFAGDSKKLSFKECFPPIYKYLSDTNQSTFLRALIKNYFSKEKNQSSTSEKIINDPNLHSIGMYSFTEGIQQLPNELLAFMENNYSERLQILKNTQIFSINENKNSNLQIQLLDNKTEKENFVNVDHFFSSLPSFELAKIFERSSKVNNNCEFDSLISLLNSINYVNVAVVTLVWDHNIRTSYNGFGYLVSPEAKQSILGVTFDRYFIFFKTYSFNFQIIIINLFTV